MGSGVDVQFGEMRCVNLVHQFVGGKVRVEVGDGTGLEHVQLAIDDAPLDVARVAVVGGDLWEDELDQVG